MSDEFALLETLLRDIPGQAEGLLAGVGDDCAVLAASGTRDWVISTDQQVEGIHFNSAWASWEQIGRRAALAAVSDIAAMGGRPRFLLVGLGVPKSMPVAEISCCFAGIRQTAQQCSMIVIGGDTTSTLQGVVLGITVLGEVVHGRSIYRRGARAGDTLYVTGTFGGSAAGLHALQQGLHGATYDGLIARHLAPPCRVAAGQWLASTGCVSALIDVSDGLVQDVGHIAAMSGVQLQLEAIRVPLHAGISVFAHERQCDPLRVALGSGEEYELAFTVAGARAAAFRQLAAGAGRTLGHPLTPIGTVGAGTGVVVYGPDGAVMPVEYGGYAHRFGEPTAC